MKAVANDLFDGILTSECHDSSEEEKSKKSDKDNPSACFSNSTTQHARVSCWRVRFDVVETTHDGCVDCLLFWKSLKRGRSR